jgi:hypothetical protein
MGSGKGVGVFSKAVKTHVLLVCCCTCGAWHIGSDAVWCVHVCVCQHAVGHVTTAELCHAISGNAVFISSAAGPGCAAHLCVYASMLLGMS